LQIGDGGFYCVGCPKLFPRKPSKHHKETEHPEEPEHPKEKETKHPKEKETKYPKEKETKHPKEKETKHPKEKETKHPEEKETKHPKEKEDPKEKETKDPKEKETKDPKEKETKDPKEKETKDPKEKETKAPYEKEDRRRGYLTEEDLRKLFAKRAKRSLNVRGGHDKDKPRHCQTRGKGQLPLAPIHSHFHTYRFHHDLKYPDHKHPDDKHPDHKHPDHKDQSHTFGPIFDGSFGIDTEDLANAPGIDFTTLQYYPDQMVLIGSSFMPRREKREWDCALSLLGFMQAPRFGKPIALTAFGVLIDESRKKFVPFNPNDEGKCATGCLLSQWD